MPYGSHNHKGDCFSHIKSLVPEYPHKYLGLFKHYSIINCSIQHLVK